MAPATRREICEARAPFPETRTHGRASLRRRRGLALALLVGVAASLGGADALAQAPDPDLNGDGRVDILDVSLVASCLGRLVPPPEVTIEDPGDGSVVESSPVLVSGTVDASGGAPCRPADANGDGGVGAPDFAYVAGAFGEVGFPVGPLETSVRVNGVEAVLAGDRFTASVMLSPGPNDVVAEARAVDGSLGTDSITLTLAPPNTRPQADAGPDQTPRVGDVVTLDGSASSDADGDPLTFAWELTPPAGSGAQLSDPSAVMPTFEVDRPGSYRAELVVSDAEDESAPDTVLVATENSPPVADAGPDQSVFVTDLVTLDGSGSSDVDGDTLRYAWELTSAPAGSSAALANPTAVFPNFVVDAPGSYEATLVVNDGRLDSDPDTVSITTLNSPPVADAGPDNTLPVGDLATLDGSGSSDVDGDPLRYSWSLTALPPGSDAELSDPTAVMPSFVLDLPGTYVAQLVVNDGQLPSDPDTVTILTENSPPVADAGRDQTPLVGERVTLDGSGSSDVDGDLLRFEWSLVSRPSGSGAELSDPSAVLPTFTVDVPGTYVAQLTVNDGRVSSDPDTVTLDTTSTPPVADAGPDQTVPVGERVTLDGSASSDVDGDRLFFEWSLVSVQPGSTATLADRNSVFPSFVADLPGTYIAQLIVDDGFGRSAPDTVRIDTENSPPVADAGPDQTAELTQTVTLDASGSSDADRDLLTLRWSFTALPPGSAAALSNPEAPLPTFVVDLEGTYVIQLIVDDGSVASAPDSVVVSTINSAPVADAGPDQTVFVTEPVTLDGSGSDDVDGDPLDYRWAVTAVPPGSAVRLDDPFAERPRFSADVPGAYVAQLIVSDGVLVSRPNSVVVRTDNSPPLADAGPDQRVRFGETVTLDGSASSDVDGDPLAFRWQLLSAPQGSSAALFDATAELSGFVPDVPGQYRAELVVSDGALESLPDEVVIEVEPLPVINVFASTLGAGLQARRTGSLQVSNHGGVLVRIASSDAGRVLVAPDELTPGAAALELFVPDGVAEFDYIEQGVAGASGQAEIAVSAEGFSEGVATVTLEPPAVALLGLNESLPLGIDDDFQVLIGVADSAGLELTSLQSASAANAAPLRATVTSSDEQVGQLTRDGTTAPSLSFEIPVGAFQTDLVFTQVGGGTTTVSAEIPGFLATAAASQDVTVALPSITTVSSTIGAGLQSFTGATLGVSDHGGVTVRVESSLPAVALVAPDATTPGFPFIDVFVPNGSRDVPFVIQGVVDRVGVATITISASGFSSGVGTATVVQPGLTISGLSERASVGSVDAFFVLIGIPDGAGTGLVSLQGVSAANAPPLVLTLASSDGGVGGLAAGGASGASITLEPAPGDSQARAALVPLAVGNTTVSAEIPRFLGVTGASVDVTVDPPGISIFSRTVGAGLQSGETATLDVADHGGVSVRIESGDPSLALIAPDATTPGAAFLDVFVPDGSRDADYVVQGVAGASGAVTVTVSAPGFRDGEGVITVVQPALTIAGLGASVTAGSGDRFLVLIGVPNAAGTLLASLQDASAANAPPLVLTLASSDGGVGQLSADGSTAAELMLELEAGSSQRAADFTALAPGDTVVEASVPGFLQVTGASQSVSVTPP